MDINQALALDNGARFFRGDLHIHSIAGSHDVSDATATPEAIVATARTEGLDIIAIADHNEIAGVGPAIEAAEGTGLLVVPAVELSTAHGHILCYFGTLDALTRFHAKLSLADRNTAHTMRSSMATAKNGRKHSIKHGPVMKASSASRSSPNPDDSCRQAGPGGMK